MFCFQNQTAVTFPSIRVTLRILWESFLVGFGEKKKISAYG